MNPNFSKLMAKFNELGLKTPASYEPPAAPPDEKDDYCDDYYSDDEFSDFESDEDVAVSEDSGHYNDVSAVEYHNGDNGPLEREDLYENPEVLKTNEMQKPPPHLTKTNDMGKAAPSLPPRKTDAFPQPPTRHKKGKKPSLPEKIVSDTEDNQFYEEMDPMTLKSTCTVSPTKNVSVSSTKYQQNRISRHMKEEDESVQAPSVPPCRKIPAIPSKKTNDTTTTNKTSMSNSSVSSRPRIELPKEKTTDNPLNTFRWYHGNSERMVVEKKLMQYKMDGMFAVRNSTTKGPSYPYAITLFQNGKTFNFPVRIRDSDKRFALGTEKKDEPNFAKLDILVDYFKTNKIKLKNDQFALLDIPLDRSS